MDADKWESRLLQILGYDGDRIDGQVALATAEEASDLHRSDLDPPQRK